MGSLTRTTRRILGLFASPDVRKITAVIPLHKYLDQAYKKVKSDPGDKLGPDLGLRTCIPISIFLRSKGTGHEYAGVTDEIAGTVHHLDEEECFSGSLIKVAAMFAAFQLRAEARALAKEVKSGTVVITGGTDALKVRDFFNKLEPKLNLGAAVPQISGAANTNKKPIFAEILEITGGFAASATLDVQFTTDFKDHMRRMIVPSDNCSAGECIFRLSYPYINVKLMEAGFFNKDSMKGVWLCGDYIVTSPPADACFNKDKSRPFIRIDTVNDCDQVTHFCGSAQNTTAKQLASLFFKILLKELVDEESSQEMRTLLHEGQFGTPPMRERSFLTRPSDCTTPLLFDVDAVKIGQGPSKRDPGRGGADLQVRSEGLLIKWKHITPGEPDFDPALKKKFDDLNLTGEGAICWQNFPNQLPTGGGLVVDGIAEIINTALANFINQVPLTTPPTTP